MVIQFKQLVIVWVLLSSCCGFSKTFVNSAEMNNAIALYQSGDTEKAIQKLKEVSKAEPGNIMARQMLGEIYASQKQWYSASVWMKSVLKLEKQNVTAKLILAKINRDKGYFSNDALQLMYWRPAENYYKSIIATDSTVNRVLYEYSILKGYKGKYWEAIKLLKKHLTIYPDDQAAFYKMYFYYDAICTRGKNKDIKKLNSTDDLSMYFTGEYYRMHDQPEKAKTIFESLQQSKTVSVPAVYLSLAKTACQQGRNLLADTYYKQAMFSVSSWGDAAIVFNDMKYVFSDAELQFYNDFTHFMQAKNFFIKSWLRRNPYPTAPVNFRIIEHINRCNYAEKHYRKIRLGGKRWQALYSENVQVPEIYNLADRYEDRGIIYIRYGAPDERSIAFGGLTAQSDNLWFGNIKSGESWCYFKTGNFPVKIFHFYKTDDEANIYPILQDVMIQDCMYWDKRYFSLLSAGDLIEKHMLREIMIVENNKLIFDGLQGDYYYWPANENDLVITCYTTAVKQEDSTIRNEVFYQLDAKWFNDIADKDIQVQFSLGVFDKNWNVIDARENLVSLREITAAMDSTGYWRGIYPFTLETKQPCYVSIFAQIPELEKMGGCKFKYEPAIEESKDNAGN